MTERTVLGESTRQLVDGRNFAVVATINPDGSPQTSVVWVGLDGDTVVFSSLTSRRKTRNLARDPRISLTILDSEDPYHTVEIRGTAELTDDPDKELPRTLSLKYTGEEPPPEPADMPRSIVRVIPEKVIPFKV
ncbi:PPOX class F420-dependent oxidoreductase [Actinophytocola oryzae]|uniref:PPOX class probable F420-dependent enzyme n=1 Tax=Actinophytocola oryzae TaxID=502181 RepID=A0A4R7VUU7_9PSEU|nr:PPOX class F420-dependent oxidoreductase [Actinophytocola oryzae]TDV53760.1 PPOX class probable F420-dependent enzyme [Actinophytocola oryzae]